MYHDTPNILLVCSTIYHRKKKMDINLDELDLRTLQRESARALMTMDGSSASISKFNKQAHHNSQLWYKAVLEDYINAHGGLPCDVGPAKDIVLFSEKIGV